MIPPRRSKRVTSQPSASTADSAAQDAVVLLQAQLAEMLAAGMDAVAMTLAVAATFETLAKTERSARLRQAADIIAGRRSVGGRKPLDDSRALDEIERHIAKGTSVRRAVSIEAGKLAAKTGADRDAVAHRLRRKIKADKM